MPRMFVPDLEGGYTALNQLANDHGIYHDAVRRLIAKHRDPADPEHIRTQQRPESLYVHRGDFFAPRPLARQAGIGLDAGLHRMRVGSLAEARVVVNTAAVVLLGALPGLYYSRWYPLPVRQARAAITHALVEASFTQTEIAAFQAMQISGVAQHRRRVATGAVAARAEDLAPLHAYIARGTPLPAPAVPVPDPEPIALSPREQAIALATYGKTPAAAKSLTMYVACRLGQRRHVPGACLCYAGLGFLLADPPLARTLVCAFHAAPECRHEAYIMHKDFPRIVGPLPLPGVSPCFV